MKSLRRTILAWAAGLAWISLTAAGFGSLWRYESTPGADVVFASSWPASCIVPLDRHRFTLMVFVHPQCPCSRATISDLTRVMTVCQGEVIARVLFIRPTSFPAGWEQTDMWRDAAKIPGVYVSCDVDGVEARRFGATTSGQTALYDPAGHLLFEGGITDSRGHAGDNAGTDAIVELVHEQREPSIFPAHVGKTAVFGCSLFDAQTLTTPGRSSR